MKATLSELMRLLTRSRLSETYPVSIAVSAISRSNDTRGRQSIPLRIIKSSSLFFGDPFVSTLIKEVEGERSAIDHGIMESAYIEAWAQLLLRAIAQLTELELAQLIGKGLRRVGDVAIRLALDKRLLNSS